MEHLWVDGELVLSEYGDKADSKFSTIRESKTGQSCKFNPHISRQIY